jgi:cyclopropane fatty-acyl-phospholipid synthase-like methyltransferase
VGKAWNHNTHYHRTLLRLVPDGCDLALDVGCGDGAFARRLATKSRAVVAIDSDEQQVELARRRCGDLENISVLREDFLTAQLGHAAFDIVTALASFHHFSFSAAIDRSRALLRPGGRLIVLGVWTDNVTARDQVLNSSAGVANKLYQRIWGPDVMSAPAATPEMTLGEVRQLAGSLSPRATVRRQLLWRYVMVWQKPAG